MTRKRYTPTYQSWQAMKQRCLQPGHMHFMYYGGKGINVCERWMTYTNFLADLGPRPEGASLDRIDNMKNYEPSNCRWATRTEQNRNSSHNQLVTLGRVTRCLSEWCELLDMNYHRVYARLFRLKWSVVDAFFR